MLDIITSTIFFINFNVSICSYFMTFTFRISSKFEIFFYTYVISFIHFYFRVFLNPLTAKDETSCPESLIFLWSWILRWSAALKNLKNIYLSLFRINSHVKYGFKSRSASKFCFSQNYCDKTIPIFNV